VSANREDSDAPATSGIEAAARKLRYDFFRKLAKRERIARIVTAHTLDDQAETVLLRVFRGTGIRGLAGIRPRLRLSDNKEDGSLDGFGMTNEVVRPLLGFRRAELRDYLQALGQSWREDSTNENVAFLRNRVRRKLLPIIAQEFGGASIEHLAELAEIARAEDEWCSAELKETAIASERLQNGLTLDVPSLLDLRLAMQRRLVRAWLEVNAPEASISFRLIEDILELARGDAGKRLDLPWTPTCEGDPAKNPDAAPAKISLRRGRHDIALAREYSRQLHDYQYRLAVPGEISIPELETSIEMQMVDVARIPKDQQQWLLDPARIGAEVVIRNWRSGDRYWAARTSAEKKVKELLSDRHVSGTEKKLWPVAVVSDSQLVWMRGFAVPEAFRAQTEAAILIREVELRSRSKR
jgi:tRNA(Ile)-lysidine synthase